LGDKECRFPSGGLCLRSLTRRVRNAGRNFNENLCGGGPLVLEDISKLDQLRFTKMIDRATEINATVVVSA
jgi:methylmalonyl-CoA mutase cobalamin-binding subunit